jgi:hypothetical protein
MVRTFDLVQQLSVVDDPTFLSDRRVIVQTRLLSSVFFSFMALSTALHTLSGDTITFLLRI